MAWKPKNFAYSEAKFSERDVVVPDQDIPLIFCQRRDRDLRRFSYDRGKTGTLQKNESSRSFMFDEKLKHTSGFQMLCEMRRRIFVMDWLFFKLINLSKLLLNGR